MARHHFRSQPTLQRSGGGASSSLMGIGLVVVLAIGAGVLVSTTFRALDTWANRPAETARAENLTPVAPAQAPAALAPQLAQAAPEAVAAPPPRIVKATAPKKPRALKSEKAESQAAPADGKAQWARQQSDYQLARTAYDANERAEGYRWARQNKVRTPRYCRPLEQQRNSAFMEGCLNYASQKSSATGGGGPVDPG